MFEEFPIIIGFLVFSIIVSYFLLEFIPRPFDKIIIGLMIIGIVIHELFHVLMCFITNTPVSNVKFLDKIKREENPGYIRYEFNGSVNIREGEKLSLLQAVLVALAPLLFSFWLCILLVDQVIHPRNAVSFFLSSFIILSIIFSAAPSSTDLKIIPKALRNNPQYSFYQILLLLLSIFCVWLIMLNLKQLFLHEIIVYILVMVFYYIWKYGFRFLNYLKSLVLMRFNSKISQKRCGYWEFIGKE